MNFWCVLIGSGLILLDSVLWYLIKPSGVFYGIGIGLILIGVIQPFEEGLRSLEKTTDPTLKNGSES